MRANGNSSGRIDWSGPFQAIPENADQLNNAPKSLWVGVTVEESVELKGLELNQLWNFLVGHYI
jgi:hypothetical protein